MDNWTAEVRAQADNFQSRYSDHGEIKSQPRMWFIESLSQNFLRFGVVMLDIPMQDLAIESLPDVCWNQ